MWARYPYLTEWQVENLLNEADDPELEVLSYDEMMRYSWKLRGFSDEDADRILSWQKEKLTDEQLFRRIEEQGLCPQAI